MLCRCYSFLTGCGGSSGSGGSNIPPADFVVSLSAPSVFVPIGVGSGTIEVSVQALNGFNQPVAVSLAGLPSGVSTNPASPFNVSPGSKQTVTITASSLSPVVQNATVQAVAGSVSHSAPLAVSVAEPVYAYVIDNGYGSNPPHHLAGYAVDANTGALSALAGAQLTLPHGPIGIAVVSESTQTFVFVLDTDNNGVSAVHTLTEYSVDAGTGSLAVRQTITYPSGTLQNNLAVHPSGKFLYVDQGSCILAYLIDPVTGNLTQSSCSPGSVMPGVLTIAPPGDYAYSIETDLFATMHIHSVNQQDGSLTRIQSFDLGDMAVGYLFSDPKGLALYYLPPAQGTGCRGEVRIWSINHATGGLTNLNTAFGPANCHPVSMTFDDDRFAYVTTEGASMVNLAAIYGGSVNGNTGDLINIPGSPFATDLLPLYGEVEPSQGKFLIEAVRAFNSTTDQLVPYSIDPHTGALTRSTGVAATLPPQTLRMVIVAPKH